MSYNPMLRINPPLTITAEEVEHGVGSSRRPSPRWRRATISPRNGVWTMKLRGALVGYGAVAQQPTPGAARPGDLSIVAVADADPARLAWPADLLRGAALPQPGIPSGRETQLDSSPGDPPWVHGPQVLAALQRGVHVLCEKPWC